MFFTPCALRAAVSLFSLSPEYPREREVVAWYTPTMPIERASDRSLPERLVQFIAIIGLVCGVMTLVVDLLECYHNGIPAVRTFGVTTGDWFHRVINLLFFAQIASHILLVTASVGLLFFRTWGLRCMLIWAGMEVALFLAMHSLAFVQVRDYFREHPTPGFTAAYAFWLQFGDFVWRIVPAAACLFVLRRREVRVLFVRVSPIGFDAIPFAQASPGTQST